MLRIGTFFSTCKLYFQKVYFKIKYPPKVKTNFLKISSLVVSERLSQGGKYLGAEVCDAIPVF